jgi:hypothetical protein
VREIQIYKDLRSDGQLVNGLACRLGFPHPRSRPSYSGLSMEQHPRPRILADPHAMVVTGAAHCPPPTAHCPARAEPLQVRPPPMNTGSVFCSAIPGGLQRRSRARSCPYHLPRPTLQELELDRPANLDIHISSRIYISLFFNSSFLVYWSLAEH